ncbi:MAG TPA: amidohydrolase [Gemmatimonadaceae bacterium]|nr:amidohydrolase [Gemmatimonadaceae bacterium]
MTDADQIDHPQAAPLAVVNARVWTGDDVRPWADALLTNGERIAVVGSSAEVMKRARGSARVVDAGGMLVVPGFIDSHIHLLIGGLGLSSVQLRDARTPQEFARRIEQFALTRPAGSWIRNGDWDHELWGGELPRREWIDAATPNTPVWVNRLDGHMSLANSAALRAAGITRDTADVDGGTIVRDAVGEPMGVLKDNAQSLVDRVVPALADAELDDALDAAMRFVASHGVTSVHHMGTWEDLSVFERAHAAGRLRTRIYAAVPIDTWERLRDRVESSGRGDEWLRIGALKGFVDGSLGSHTAAMLEPFTDAPNDRGLFVNTINDLRRWSLGADASGLHLIVHAIGDHAIRTQLDVYESVLEQHGPRDRRWRIEHAQHLSAPDVPRFKSLGVIASMQPYHAIDDGRWAERVIGPERAKLTYAVRSLLDAGARVAFGSDWFVAPPTPLEGIYAAVTRRTLDGRNPDGWIPEQRITVEEALRAYTREGAFASFEERDKGSLTAGRLADFVVIDRDITRLPPVETADARVMMTVVGGRVVHEIL